MAQVTLGDVAIESRETYKGDKSGMPIVGLEHLIPEDVVLSLWDRDKENTFTKMFRKGDMLFGRRRAYLKKAAQAPFDGICSGDITVIRAKEDRLIPELLPFIIQNDVLFDFAVGKSAGSLSPRVKWENLKNYKFELPPLPEQKKLAEALWAINDTLQAYQKLLIETDELVKSQFIEMFGELDKNTKQFPVRKLNEISSYWNGLTYKPADAVKDGTGTLVLRSSNIQNGALAFEDNVYVNCEIKEKLFVQDNDILMCSRNGSAALVGKTALIKGLVEPTTFGAFMMIIRSEYYSYLKTYFETPFFRSQISTGTSTINQITGKMLNDISLPVPDMDTVRKFESFVHQSDKSKFALQNAISAARETKRSIIADALGIKGKE